MLVLKDITGNTCSGRRGLGMAHLQQWSKASEEKRRKMVQREVRGGEEHRKAKAVDLSKQGAWTKWNLPERKVSWTELWRMEPVKISFMLRSVYDTLPSPSNLYQWGLAEDRKCTLCGERYCGYQDVRQHCNKVDTDGGTTEYDTTIAHRCTGERTSEKKTKRESTKTIY